ncbi:MAG TPA: hypothetical protein EYG71_07485 [Leucothrix sp.]|nr:hypothetical protein [Leucothrix sp.]
MDFSALVKIRTIETGKNRGHHVKLFLSEDDKFDANDVNIFNSNCTGAQCDGYIDYHINCDFGFYSDAKTKMQFYCNTNNANGLGTIDTRFLNTLPKRAYILLMLSGYDNRTYYKIVAKAVEIN